MGTNNFIIEHHKQVDFRNLIRGNLQKNHAGGEFAGLCGLCDYQHGELAKKYLNKNLHIRSIDLILTEKCSLKCKLRKFDAILSGTKNIEKQELIDDLADLLVADEVNEIRIISEALTIRISIKYQRLFFL